MAAGPWLTGAGGLDGTLPGLEERASALTGASLSHRPLPHGLGDGLAAVVSLFPQVLAVAVGELKAGGNRRLAAGAGALLLPLERGRRPAAQSLGRVAEELAAEQVAGGGGGG